MGEAIVTVGDTISGSPGGEEPVTFTFRVLP
jgi:hypothetical protein